MKVYVDELPKKCEECPFNRMTFFWTSNVFEKCNATNECQLGFSFNCRLKSLADYTKQVRKEVLGELMNMLGDRAELIQTAENESTFMFDTYDLTMCVKEILGEEEKQNEK